MPKISVIMPSYNSGKYISGAIDSILNQTFSDFELIIIDDGSDDDTVKIIKSYTDNRIQLYLNEKNIGVASTLNRGLFLAKGEFIARMDSDDISLPNRFEKQLEYLYSNPQVAVVGTGIKLFGERTGNHFFSSSSKQLKVDTLFSCCLAHPSVMMRASVFGEGKLKYDEAYNKIEDFDLWVRTIEKYDIGSIHETLLEYRIHSGQVTQNYNETMKRQLLRLKERQMQKLGIDINCNGFDLYIEYCLGKLIPTKDTLIELGDFFESVKEHNKKFLIYDIKTLDNTLYLIMKSLLLRISSFDACEVVRKCHINPLKYLLERSIGGIIRSVRNYYLIQEGKVKY